MLSGLLFTFLYIVYFKFLYPENNLADNWLLGISPDGIGTLGALLNFLVAITVSKLTNPPPEDVVALVKKIRLPESIENN